MSTELREVGDKIRTDASVKYGRGHIPYREVQFLCAVADWLDAEFSHEFGPTEQAIAVACAYRGAA